MTLHIPDSQRLRFRLMDEHDGDLMYELDQDPEVMRYIAPGRVPNRDDITSVFIPRMQSYRSADKGWGLWQVNTLADNEFIGFILVRPMYFFQLSATTPTLSWAGVLKRAVGVRVMPPKAHARLPMW